MGHVDEKHYYTVNTIKSYDILGRWIIINGDIDREIVNNGRSFGKQKISSVKIARAFDSDKEIISFINKNGN